MERDPKHVHLESAPPVTATEDFVRWNKLVGHQKVTDAYLVRLAEISGSKLLTFDRRLAGLGRKDAVEVIPVLG